MDIVKWIRLQLDKKSADQAEKDTKSALGGVDDAFGKIKATALKVGAAIAAAFSVRAIINFGKTAVQEALKAERQYAQLAAVVNATGESYQDLEADVLASAEAFEKATIHDDGEYAEGLQRVIALTGDVSASMNNMGLVADVAATFFDGQLAPAADAVAKAMTGNFTALQRMGIQAESAQEALEILAERSMGAATARAATLDGQVKQLNNAWGNFQKEVGFAITQSEGAGIAVRALGAGVQFLRDWVDRNKDAIALWVTRGINWAIDAADVLLRTVLGLADLFQGGFKTSIGIAAIGVSYLARAYALAYEAAAKFLDLIGAEKAAASLKGTAEVMREGADAIREWAEAAIAAGSSNVARGLNQFTRPLFTSGQFANAPAAGPAGLPTNAPQVAAGAVTPISEALEKFGETMKANGTLSRGLGADFDALAAEAKALETVMQELALAGVNELDPMMQGFADRLREVRREAEDAEQLKAVSEIFTAYVDELAVFDFANENAMEGLGEQASEMVYLQNEADLLQRAMVALVREGIDPADERYQVFATRLAEVNELIRAQTMEMELQAMAADFLAQAVGAAIGGGLAPFAKSKAKQNLIEAAEMSVRAGIAALTGFGAFSAGAYLRAAGQHAALAATWGALAASMGGGGAGGAAAPSGGGGGGGGVNPTTARTTSSSATNRAQPLPAEVTIVLSGPGFHALNPEVQSVVRGAAEQATERFGNARVRVVRRNT